MSGQGLANSTTNVSCSPYDSTSYVVVAAVSAGLSGLSLILLSGVIFILVLFKKWRFFSQRLILYLATSSILVNIGIILHRVDYYNQTTDFYVKFCEFGGFLDQVANWMLLMSVCSITTFVFLKIFFNKNTEKLEFLYLFLIFAFPLTFAWIPFIWGAYGRAGAWCWIRFEERGTCEPYYTGQVLQYMLWFGPLYVLMFILIIIYVLLLFRLYRKPNEWTREYDVTNTLQRKKMTPHDLKPLIVYPLLYFLLNIFPFINRTYNLVITDSPILALWYLSALANPSMGTLITVAYCMDPETRKRLNLKHIRGATMEWFRRNEVVTSYSIEVPENGTLPRTDSYIPQDQHPYKNYKEYCDLKQDSMKICSLPRKVKE